MQKKIAIIIPTLNGGATFKFLLESITNQTLQPQQRIVIDSESNDETVKLAKSYDFSVVEIKRQDFNHGATRQFGVSIVPEADIIIFLTQDVILADSKSLERLVAAFYDKTVGAAYGRQLPCKGAGPIGVHARLFNYKGVSMVKSMDDAPQLGIKTAFFSNSFAAYRRETLLAVGGFPQHTILGEDTYVAAKMLLSGWKIAYCADAQVYHSHDYNFIQEFRRYFDIGVFHVHEPWLRETFGQAEGEGLKFVLSETKYLMNHGKGYLLPSAFVRTVIKYIGYRLGMKEKSIPVSMKKYLSMHKHYWNSPEQRG